ncbi:MAG: S1 RNA-binding domain-containing protein [Microthrixaceae bacterium]
MSIEPEPLPDPGPEPLPTPEPLPGPFPSPEPQPLPEPEPTPAPSPTPTPSPDPLPDPLPDPGPSPLPEPGPSPVPVPEPNPAPEPGPAPMPQPGPTPVIGQSAPAGATVGPPVHADKATEQASSGGVTVGRIVTVTIAAVQSDEVEVRLADGRVGVIPRGDFSGPPTLGDSIEAALLAREDPKKRAVLSLSWARKQQAWERLDAAKASNTPVTGKVTKVVKGGVVVDVGLRGFLPTSLLSDTPGTDPASLVGTEVEALVMEADRGADRIVLSVRDLQRRRRRAKERESLRSLTPGAKVSGRVVSVVDYGAVVDLGGVRGLVHRSELTWGRLEQVGDIVSVGDTIEVVVLDVNKSKRRIGLSLRQVQPDPLDQVAIGSIESATVVRVVDYGVFARLDATGADGLVHISELSDVPGYRPDELVTPGEQVMVKVLGVDKGRRRMALSVRRVLVDD